MRGSDRQEGLKVKEYVRNLIEGKTLTIETFKVEKYGRYICEIYLDDGARLSEHLLAKGMAKVYID
ncbi:MAG: thermonuclease family protein [Dehalococcoidia bacterium]